MTMHNQSYASDQKWYGLLEIVTGGVCHRIFQAALARAQLSYPCLPRPTPRTERIGEARMLLRKEVIQPQVPLRLPCYDFIPVTTHTFGA